MSNATYLFEKPSRLMKNSESRWAAVAQMSLIYISANMPGIRLPVYESDDDGYLTAKGEFLVSGFTYLNTVCENGLTGENFGIQDFDKRFAYIKPDILHIDKKNKKVVLIEVKTLSESVVRNISLYHHLYQYLHSSSWDCNLYYLLSHGHEKKKDWPVLAKQGSSIITWEDLFGVMAQTPLADLIGDCLSEYCDPPAKRG